MKRIKGIPAYSAKTGTFRIVPPLVRAQLATILVYLNLIASHSGHLILNLVRMGKYQVINTFLFFMIFTAE
jgi:hypothetical protein